MPASLSFDPFQTRDTLETGSGKAGIYRLNKLEEQGLGTVSKLPFSIRVLLESVLRHCDGYEVTEADVRSLASWSAAAPAKVEIPFKIPVRSFVDFVSPLTATAPVGQLVMVIAA